MTEPATVPIDTLLEHRTWVRSLARSIVGDVHLAEDVAQQTWVSALRAPPAHGGSIRGWLATVTRNAARKARRSEGRRAAHESAAEGPPAGPSPADLVARAEAHRLVVRAVLALPEPQRTTVLFHFFEDLPLREIGRRTGVPYETVRGRLRAALRLLRAALAAPARGHDAFGLGLLALATSRGLDTAGTGTAVATTGGVVVGIASKVTAGIAVVSLCAAAFWVGRTSAPGVDPADLAAVALRVDELAARAEAVDRAPTRGRAAASLLEGRVAQLELAAAGRRAGRRRVGGSAKEPAGTGEDAAGVASRAAELEAATKAKTDAAIDLLEATQTSLERAFRQLELRLLPEAERWEVARTTVGLSEYQVAGLQRAVAARDAAYAAATVQSVERGPNGPVAVTAVDADAVERADAEYARAFNGALNEKERGAWVEGGFAGAFGDDKPTNERLDLEVFEKDDY